MNPFDKITIKINLVTLIRIIRKVYRLFHPKPRTMNAMTYDQFHKLITDNIHLLTHKKTRDMCIKEIWQAIFGGSPDPVTPTAGIKTVYSFGINNYPGSANDLNGCINDTKNIRSFFEKNYPGFAVTLWADSAVTKPVFLNSVKEQILKMVAGDWFFIHYSGHGSYGLQPGHTEPDGYSECLYVYDSPIWDYELIDVLNLVPEGAHVVLILDSCFSGGMFSAKHFSNGHTTKNRFMPFPGLEYKEEVTHRKSVIRAGGKGWAVMAGCQEHQTCADAYISGRYEGAFTHYLIESWSKSLENFGAWNNACVEAIAEPGEYDQIPTIGGDNDIINHKICID